MGLVLVHSNYYTLTKITKQGCFFVLQEQRRDTHPRENKKLVIVLNRKIMSMLNEGEQIKSVDWMTELKLYRPCKWIKICL